MTDHEVLRLLVAGGLVFMTERGGPIPAEERIAWATFMEATPAPDEHIEAEQYAAIRRVLASLDNPPRLVPIPPPGVGMADVAYAEGWNAACDAFFGGLPPTPPLVIETRVDTTRVALQAYEAAREELFAQCCSNPVRDAWGRQIDWTKFNEAHEMAQKALKS